MGRIKTVTPRPIYDVAQIGLAFPALQVSVERAFSALKYMLQPQRANMSEEILSDILTIRFHENFFKKQIPTRIRIFFM